MYNKEQSDSDESSASHWIKAKRPPDGLWNANIVMLNDSEFLVAIGSHKIFKYSSKDGWTEYLNTDQLALEINQRSNIVVDQQSNRMYIKECGLQYTQHGKSVIPMSIIDLQRKTLIHQTARSPYGDRGHIVNANGVIHKVNIDDCIDSAPELLIHEIWDKDQHRWIPNQAASANLIQLQIYWESYFDLETDCVSILHAPSKNIILLFGGARSCDAEYIPFGLWRYHISTGEWERIELMTESNSIQGIGVALELHPNFGGGTSVVLNADQQYVMIAGAEQIIKVPDHNNHQMSDQDWEQLSVEEEKRTQKRLLGFMYVLDIREEDNYKFWMSSIEPPKSDHPYPMNASEPSVHWRGGGCCHTYHLARTDECYLLSLISGWIRTLFATEVFIGMPLPALAIVILIGDYNKSETIHWISCCSHVDNKVNHQMIPLEQILSSH